jgi:hypothetical protein
VHGAAKPHHGAAKPHLLVRQFQPFHLHVRRFAPHCAYLLFRLKSTCQLVRLRRTVRLNLPYKQVRLRRTVHHQKFIIE